MSYKYPVSLTEQNLSVDVTIADQVPRKLNRIVDTIESLYVEYVRPARLSG